MVNTTRRQKRQTTECEWSLYVQLFAAAAQSQTCNQPLDDAFWVIDQIRGWTNTSAFLQNIYIFFAFYINR